MSMVTVSCQIDELISKMRVLWNTRRYTYTELKTDPNDVFAEIMTQIYRLVEATNGREILVLTPWLF